MERVSAFIATDWMSLNGRTDVIDFGGNRYTQSTGQLRFNLIVETDTDTVTRVTVNTSMRGELPGPLSAPSLTGYSTGRLESEMGSAVTRRVR